MGTRIISGFVMLVIVLPLIFIGGIPFQIFVYLCGMYALKEFMGLQKGKKEIPLFVQFISYLLMTFLFFSKIGKDVLVYMMDFRVISAFFLSLLFPLVLYHDQEIYNVNDAFFLIGGIFFLGISFHLIVLLRELNIHLLVYLGLIACITDIYAYFTGVFFGRTKLITSVSPKKTVEGMIGGTLFGTLIPMYYYLTVINPTASIMKLIGITLFLSLVGQIGDLIFSSMKRYYKKKDFSNLIPGHGGILDRLDSIIFIILCFPFFLYFI